MSQPLLTNNKVLFLLNGTPMSHITEFLLRGASDSLVFYVELLKDDERNSYVIESIKTGENSFVEFHLKRIETTASPLAAVLDFKKIIKGK